MLLPREIIIQFTNNMNNTATLKKWANNPNNYEQKS